MAAPPRAVAFGVYIYPHAVPKLTLQYRSCQIMKLLSQILFYGAAAARGSNAQPYIPGLSLPLLRVRL